MRTILAAIALIGVGIGIGFLVAPTKTVVSEPEVRRVEVIKYSPHQYVPVRDDRPTLVTTPVRYIPPISQR